jgi:hypothetical protein
MQEAGGEGQGEAVGGGEAMIKAGEEMAPGILFQQIIATLYLLDEMDKIPSMFTIPNFYLNANLT